MNKKYNIALISASFIPILLTVLASFYDYEIAVSTYIGQMPQDNIFGVTFAFLGIAPTFVGWSFLGASILCLLKKHKMSSVKYRWLLVLAVLLLVLSFFYFCNTLLMVNSNAFRVHWAIAYPIGIAVLAFAYFLGYKLSEKSTNPKLMNTVLLLSIISLVIMIVIMSTKGIMNRPRYRFVMESEQIEYFRNWWQSGKDIKNSLGSSTITDEFSSFPSGHSAYSMFAVFLFPALADYIPRLEKCKGLLLALGFIWWGLTAFSRMTVGAHYLSDVAIAGLVSIICYFIVISINALLKKNS